MDENLAIDALIAALQDSNPEARARAATALGRINNPRAIAHLIARLNDPDSLVAGYASDALVTMQESTVEPLIEALRHSSPRLAAMAAHTLGEINDPLAIDPLLTLLDSPHAEVQIRAIEALGKIGNNRAFIALEAKLNVPGAPRTYILLALASLGHPRAVRPCINALIEAALQEDYELWQTAQAGLEKLGRVALSSLLELLAHPSPQVRVYAIETLRAMNTNDPQAIKALHHSLKDDHEVVRSAAQIALDRIEPHTEF